jgi:hypothetical protein
MVSDVDLTTKMEEIEKIPTQLAPYQRTFSTVNMWITVLDADDSITLSAKIALRILRINQRSLRLSYLPEVVKMMIALHQRFCAAEDITYLSMVKVSIAIVHGRQQCYISRWDSSLAARINLVVLSDGRSYESHGNRNDDHVDMQDTLYEKTETQLN